MNRDELKNVPKILIGNKRDLNEERKVEIFDGENFAKQNRIKFFETSAKDNYNVKAAFTEIINDLFEKKKKDEEELKGAQEKENKNKKSSIYLKEKKKDSDGEKSNCCHHCWG